MKLAFLHPHNPPDLELHYWRCLVQAEAINRTRRHSARTLSLKDFVLGTEMAESICGKADILIIQHDLVASVLSAVQHWKARDKTIILDIQKPLDDMLPGSPRYQKWIKSLQESEIIPGPQLDPEGRVQLEWGLKLVDGATVATEKIEREWQDHARINYLPVYIPIDSYSNVSRETHPGTVIGWIAGNPPRDIFLGSNALKALNQICQAYPSIRVLFADLEEDTFQQTPLPENQKTLENKVPREGWANLLSKIDIGVIPKQSGKSSLSLDIRALEYLVMKTPWISSSPDLSSPLEKYGTVIDDTAEDWYFRLSNLAVQTPHARGIPCSGGYLYGISRNIDDRIDDILGSYREFMMKPRGF